MALIFMMDPPSPTPPLMWPYSTSTSIFGIGESVLLKRKKLSEARQEPSETIHEFVWHLRWLIEDCEFGAVTIIMLRDVFVTHSQ